MNDLSLYNAARPYMGTFDRLEWQSGSLLGSGIRFFTKGWSNHSSALIIFHEYGRSVFNMEALEDGPDANQLSARLKTFKGKVMWYPLKPELHKHREILGIKLLSKEGIKYDVWDMIKNVRKRPKFNPDKLYCSEYVAYTGITSGLPYDPEYLDNRVPQPGEDMQGLGWWELGVRIL